MNMMVSDHCHEPPSMLDLIGNCSTTILVPYYNQNSSISGGISSLQKQILSSLEHSVIAGVDVIRMMGNKGGGLSQNLMPYVFNSSIGADNFLKNSKEEQADWQWIKTSIQTPQVYLDVQAYDQNSQLYVHWDYLSDHFRDGVIQGLQWCFEQALRYISSNDNDWTTPLPPFVLPPKQQATRKAYNDSFDLYDDNYFSENLLHSDFVKQAKSRPDAIALQTAYESISYHNLLKQATQLAHKIALKLEDQGQTIAVYTQRGVKQIVCVLSVLLSGNAYLPIDSKLPNKRVSKILCHSQTEIILCDSYCNQKLDTNFANKVIKINFDENANCNVSLLNNTQHKKNIAYIIYTSGSTGAPKGVVISHEAAINTLRDMINRFGLDESDCVLGLSALNFDLSIYDIFATFSVGGKLLLSEEQELPDPNLWLQLVEDFKPTVWNSVPALFELFLEHQDYQAIHFQSFRLVMLSGDWINPGMCRKVIDILPNLELVSLGGATEASIWSNYHRINTLPDDWPSIPYGVPLANQTLHILDKNYAPAPDWVVGDLYIGGVGVAEGYLVDEILTQRQFIEHEALGRIYKTGDLARFRQGLIEFIGRSDSQVKIRGYRIELEEIESQASKVKYVDSTIATVVVDDNGHKSIALFYTVSSQENLNENTLSLHLSSSLPSYMVPQNLLQFKYFPLTKNGKIDRKYLSDLAKEKSILNRKKSLPKNAIQKSLAKIWSHLLSVTDIDINDNFFNVGGNSILAIRMTTEIRKNFDVSLSPSHILQFNSISELSNLLENRADVYNDIFFNLSVDNSSTQDSKINSDEVVIMIHPVGGSIESYKPLSTLMAPYTLYGLQAEDFQLNQILSESTVESIAQQYAKKIEKRFSSQKIILGGWSMGAIIALSVAQHLPHEKLSAKPLLLIDPWVSDGSGIKNFSKIDSITSFIRDLFLVDVELDDKNVENTNDLVLWISLQKKIKKNRDISTLSASELLNMYRTYYLNSIRLRHHQISETDKKSVVIQSSEKETFTKFGLLPINVLNKNKLQNSEWYDLQGDHWEMMSGNSLKKIINFWKKQ